MAVQFAFSSDLEDRWGTLSPDEADRANTLLGDASRRIRARWPDVDARIASGRLDPADVVMVAVSMVKRAMPEKGAEGVESRTETAGPFGVTNKYSNPLGNLYFTADEIAIFDGYAPTRAALSTIWLA